MTERASFYNRPQNNTAPKQTPLQNTSKTRVKVDPVISSATSKVTKSKSNVKAQRKKESAVPSTSSSKAAAAKAISSGNDAPEVKSSKKKRPIELADDDRIVVKKPNYDNEMNSSTDNQRYEVDSFNCMSSTLNIMIRPAESKSAENGTTDIGTEEIEPNPSAKIFCFPTAADLKGVRGSEDDCGDPLYSSRAVLVNSYTNKFPLWLSLLDFNYSLFFYGIGARRAIVNNFIQTSLAGEDVMQIDCENFLREYRGGWKVLIMNIMRTVVEKILGPMLAAGGVQKQLYRAVSAAVTSVNDENISLIEKTKAVSGLRLLNNIMHFLIDFYADALLVHYDVSYRRESDSGRGAGGASSFGNNRRIAYDRPSRLYIILLDGSVGSSSSGHINVDPNGWADGNASVIADKREAFRCLALLASSHSVGLMASVSSVFGLSFSCDRTSYVSFKWAHIHCPCYSPTDISTISLKDFGISSGNKDVTSSFGDDGDGERPNSALLMILKSFTPKHKEVLRTLVSLSSTGEASVISKTDNRKTVIPWTTFLKKCSESMIVKGDADLQLICRELLEHRLIWRGTDSNGLLVVSVLDHIDLEKLVAML
jgi:hypothetical protein